MGIRRAAPCDIDSLVRLCREHAAFEDAAFIEHDRRRGLESALFGPAPLLFGWVAEGQEELAGYMTATIDYSTWDARRFLHMDCLFLRPAYRRMGLGRAFLMELRRFARVAGCAEIQWQTPVDNVDAIAFYRKIGAHGRPKQRFRMGVFA